MPLTDSDHITRGEFTQFERRVDERFNALDRRLIALHGDVRALATSAAAERWLGPRAWALLRLIAPAVLGAAMALVVAHFS